MDLTAYSMWKVALAISVISSQKKYQQLSLDPEIVESS